MKRSVFLVLVFVLFGVSCGTDPSVSEDRAMAFAQSANMKDATSAKCQRYDSDNNDYVSCTIFRADHDPFPLECPSRGSANSCWGDGDCRPMRLR
jgi:hypothetical protein